MSIYRVTFETSLLVDCSNEKEAERIGLNFVNQEIPELISIESITRTDQLLDVEKGSLPWRSWDSAADKLELKVEQILGEI